MGQLAFGLGGSAKAQGRTNEEVAQDLLRRGINLSSGELIHLEDGDSGLDKRALFLRAIDRSPTLARAYTKLAATLTNEERIKLLIGEEFTKKELLLRALSLAPTDSAEAWFGLANCLPPLGKALDLTKHELYLKAIETDPKDSEAYVQLGLAIHASRPVALPGVFGPPWTPRDLFLKAIDLNPNNGLPYFTIGISLEPGATVRLLSGETLGAAEFFVRSINADPSFGPSYAHLAYLLPNSNEEIKLSSGRSMTKQELLLQAVNLNPGGSLAHYRLAQTLQRHTDTLKLHNGQEMTKQELLLKVIEMGLNKGEVFAELGRSMAAARMDRIKLYSGQEITRQQLFLHAANLDPNLAIAYTGLAGTLAPGERIVGPKGRRTSDRELLLKAIDLDPTVPEPYIILGNLLAVDQRVTLPNGQQATRTDLHLRAAGLAPPDQSPFSADQKAELFRQILSQDKLRMQKEIFVIPIRRAHLFDDAFAKLNIGDNLLKQKIQIKFFNADGLEEAGIDGGGLLRELLADVIADGFSPERGLFVQTPAQTLFPNPNADPKALAQYVFLGRLVGKSVWEGLTLELPLASFFISKIKSKTLTFEDLKDFDEDLYLQLLQLKNYDGNVEDFDIYFTTTRNSVNTGDNSTVELIPNGENILVTNQTKAKYLELVTDFKLTHQIREQAAGFVLGFNEVIKQEWIRMFSAKEFESILIGGKSRRIDLDDLLNHANFSGGFILTHPTILILIEVLNDLSDDDQRRFLKFATSLSRPPLMGFKSLHPRFCFHCKGTNEELLPSSMTCMNMLKFPSYSTRDKVEAKFLYAIRSNAGFELS